MEKWPTLGLGQEVHKINLGHLAVPEKKMFKKENKTKIPIMMGGYVKRTQERVPNGQSWNSMSKK